MRIIDRDYGERVLTGLATLTKGKSRSDLGGSLVDEIANHLDVVSGHDHLLGSVRGALWPVKADGNICCTQEELRAIVVHKRSVSTTLLLGEDLEACNVSTGITVNRGECCSHISEPGTC